MQALPELLRCNPTAQVVIVGGDEVSYGSAGASLQQANAAVAVMKLAMDESGKAQETVKAYLEGMNETQRDYFSFQWQQALL